MSRGVPLLTRWRTGYWVPGPARSARPSPTARYWTEAEAGCVATAVRDNASAIAVTTIMAVPRLRTFQKRTQPLRLPCVVVVFTRRLAFLSSRDFYRPER